MMGAGRQWMPLASGQWRDRASREPRVDVADDIEAIDSPVECRPAIRLGNGKGAASCFSGLRRDLGLVERCRYHVAGALVILVFVVIFLSGGTTNEEQRLQQEILRAFEAEAKAEAAAASAESKSLPYESITSEALCGLANLPSGPRSVECWSLQPYDAPLEQLHLLEQREWFGDLLEPSAASVIPSEADIMAQAPWRRDVPFKSLSVDDWAAPASVHSEQQTPVAPAGHQHICTYGDPEYGVAVTAPLASLVAAPENGCVADRCALPVWPGRGQHDEQHAQTQQPDGGGFGAFETLCVGRAASMYNRCNTLDAHVSAAGVSVTQSHKGVRPTHQEALDATLQQHANGLKRRVIHLVSGPEPLTAREIWAMDSTFAAMPNALVRWHSIANCVGDEDAAECMRHSRQTHFAQMQIFWRAGHDLQYVQHLSLQSYFKGLPLERHAWLFTERPSGAVRRLKSVLLHLMRTLVADLLRVAIMFVEGGIYVDTDVVFLQEVRHLSNFVACEHPWWQSSFACYANQAVISMEAGHKRVLEWLMDSAAQVDGRTNEPKSLIDLHTAEEAARAQYEGQPLRVGQKRVDASRETSRGDSGGEEAVQAVDPLVRIMLMDWGAMGPIQTSRMLKLWAKGPSTAVDAREYPPTLLQSIQAAHQKQTDLGDQGDASPSAPWPGFTRVLGNVPPNSKNQTSKSQLPEIPFKPWSAEPTSDHAPEWAPPVRLVWALFKHRLKERIYYFLHPRELMFSSTHMKNPANDAAEEPSSVTLYSPYPFYPFLPFKGWDRPYIADPELWEPSARSEGRQMWKSLIQNRALYTLHLYATVIFGFRGDFGAATAASASAAFGDIMRSYCRLLCGHKRLGIFGYKDSGRHVGLNLVDAAKKWLRRVYGVPEPS